MSSNTCPHCQASLPLVTDAFCSQCGQELDEPTRYQKPTDHAENRGMENRGQNGIGYLFIGVSITTAGLLLAWLFWDQLLGDTSTVRLATMEPWMVAINYLIGFAVALGLFALGIFCLRGRTAIDILPLKGLNSGESSYV